MSYSKYILIILTAYLLVRFTQEQPWTKNRAIADDSGAYYTYLPAVFIKNDLGLERFENFEWLIRTKMDWTKPIIGNTNGRRVIKMSCGVAIMELPFFLLGHAYAKIFHHVANGYSPPYLFAIYFAALIYCILGMIVLRKLLLIFFSETITAVTLTSLLLGTNLLHYTLTEGILSHVFTFFLSANFLYFFVKFLSEDCKRYFYFACISLGMAILIRPTNAVFLIFIGLYGVFSLNEFSQRLRLFFSNPRLTAIGGALLMIPFLLQMCYWKYVRGQWIYDSYEGENFFFGNPHIADALFSYRKGWLTYTPIMIFSVFGLFTLFQKSEYKKWFFPVLIIFSVYLFIIASWWCWWYAGGFGLRPMIDLYSMLSIPFSAFVSLLFKHNVSKIVALVCLVVLIGYNLFQTWQYNKGIIHFDSMTKNAYCAVFLKDSWPVNYDALLQKPDYVNAKLGKTENLNSGK